jgi:hypothetical protein
VYLDSIFSDFLKNFFHLWCEFLMRKTAIGAIITMVSSVEELAREFT